MIRLTAALGVGVLVVACSDPGVAPGDDTTVAPAYGVTESSPYTDLGHRPPEVSIRHGEAFARGTGVANGSFESNDGFTSFADWGTFNAGVGAVFAQTGTTTPFTGFPVPSPTDGDYAAMTDQDGPGLHIVYQDVTVGTNEELQFDLYLGNLAGAYFAPNTFSFVGEPNQQFRVDIMDPSAPIDDLGAGVLANVYQTQPGDPAESGYQRIAYNLSAFNGQTVRIRFAEVDNLFFFHAGVDNVTIAKARPSGATGSGHTTTTGGDKRVFAFSALRHPNGSISGQFTLVITASVLGSENPAVTRIEAEVVCVVVDGNRAWAGGVVKSSTRSDWIGGETAWAVEDGGEGPGSADFISLVNIPRQEPGFAEAMCRNRTRTPDIPVENGQVQVR
jgi:hypothetical protein